MAAVTAIAIGVITPDEITVAPAQRRAVSILVQPEHAERAAILAGQGFAVLALRRGALSKTPGNGIQRIIEIGPARRAIPGIGGKGARLAFPPGKGALRIMNFIRRHAGEEIVTRVEGTDMVKTEPAIGARPFAIAHHAFCRGRAEFAGLGAARLHTALTRALDPAVETRARPILSVKFPRHAAPRFGKARYIGRMTPPATAPLADIIADRLTSALSPSQLEVINESHLHAGHGGDPGTGESHFAVRVESAGFAGLNRVARQRLVNQALADLLATRIHALSIRATAPGEGQ